MSQPKTGRSQDPRFESATEPAPCGDGTIRDDSVEGLHPWVVFARDIDRIAGVPHALSDAVLAKAAVVLKRAWAGDASPVAEDPSLVPGASPSGSRASAA